MTTEKQTPARTLRDGAIKAVIWRNDGEKGTSYSVQFWRSYKDASETWHEVNGFSGTELLKVAHLAGKAYDAIARLRSDDAE